MNGAAHTAASVRVRNAPRLFLAQPLLTRKKALRKRSSRQSQTRPFGELLTPGQSRTRGSLR